MVRRLLAGLALAAALPRAAHAAGYHFFKVEAVGAGRAEEYAAGFGFSMFSDLARLWLVFGDPTGDGGVVRQGWLESRRYGPVLGVVPPSFDDLVSPYPEGAWIVRWGTFRLGGDPVLSKDFEADATQEVLLDVPGLFGVDPRRAYAGPSAGLGLNGTWWHDWRDTDEPAMTGKLTARGGIVAGVTVRDTWYAQVRGAGRIDLFGAHQSELTALAVTGVFLARVGLPVGVEVAGELDRGDDNATATPATTWQGHASLYWKLAPPYRTRIEESVQRQIGEAAR